MAERATPDGRLLTLAHAVRRRRIALGLTQSAAGELAGTTGEVVHSIESGRSVRLSNLIDVLDTLGLGLTLSAVPGFSVDAGVEPLLAEPGRRAVGRG